MSEQFWIERHDSIKKEIAELDVRIIELEERRKVLRRARENAKKRIVEPSLERESAAVRDTMMVKCEEIIPYINIALKELDGNRSILAKRTGVNGRNLRRILNEGTEMMTLDMADRFLTYLGRPDVLHHIQLYDRAGRPLTGSE